MNIADLAPTLQRLKLRELGYAPVPVYGKSPVLKDWTNVAPAADEAAIRAWESDYTYALSTGIVHHAGVYALDVDCTDRAVVAALHKAIRKALPGAPLRIGNTPKAAYFFRGVDELASLHTQVPLRWTDQAGELHQLEVRGLGGQTLAFGIHPDTGRPYTWPQGELAEASKLPTLSTFAELDNLLAELRAEVAAHTPGASWQAGRNTTTPAASGSGGTSTHGTKATPEFVEALLHELPNPDLPWDDWFHGVLLPVKGALKGVAPDDGYALFEAWSAKSTRHDPAGCQRWWNSVDPRGERGIGSLVKAVKDAGAWTAQLDDELTKALARLKPKPQDEFSVVPGATTSPAPALPKVSRLEPILGPFTKPPPPRPRLYGNHVLRGAMTLLGGRGGVSKTNLALTEACAMVSGQKLLWDRVWLPGLRVLHLNRDEDQDELTRRLLGISLRYQLGPKELGGLLAFGRDRLPSSFRLVSGASQPEIDLESISWLVDLLKRWKADVLQIDPLVSFVSGETNDHFALLAGALQRVMNATGVSVYVLHHIRKSGGGGGGDDSGGGGGSLEGVAEDADALRGGGALVDLARTVRLARGMTKGQAEALHVADPRVRRRLVSLNAAAKENYFASAYDLTWYQLESVGLGNASAPWPEDQIGVPVGWSPAALGVLSLSEQAAVLNGIKQGVGGAGMPWSTHWQSGDRHVRGLFESLGIDPDVAGRQVDEWLRGGVLHETATVRDDVTRKVRRGLGVSREPIPEEFA